MMLALPRNGPVFFFRGSQLPMKRKRVVVLRTDFERSILEKLPSSNIPEARRGTKNPPAGCSFSFGKRFDASSFNGLPHDRYQVRTDRRILPRPKKPGPST